jgi:nucleotide-binding universal stress UspA family protein
MTDQSDHIVQDNPRIVVGIDGSPGSKTALQWAMTQAKLVGARVEAVASWQDPAMNGYSLGWAPEPYDGESLARLTQKTLDGTIDDVLSGLDRPVEVSTRVVEGHPAQVLPDVAVGAQMLVVGTRGHGTFAGILLGSVSQHCVQHAPCPVVVVPA